MLRKVTWTTVLLAAASMTSTVRGQSEDVFTGYHVRHDLPLAANATNINRCAIGDLTGNFKQDLLILDQANAFISMSVGHHRTVVQMVLPGNPTVIDGDYLKTPSQKNDFVVLADDGLHPISWDVVASDFVVEPKISAGGWGFAKSARAANLDGGGRADLIGLNAGKNRVLRLRNVTGIPTFESAITLGATADEVIPVQWDADPEDEIAVLLKGNNEIRIYDSSGGHIRTQSIVDPVAMVSMNRGHGSYRLAVIKQETNGNQSINLLDGSGVTFSLTFGPIDVTAVTAGDADGDGDFDLLMANRTNYIYTYFENLELNDYSPPPPGSPFVMDPQHVLTFDANPQQTATNNLSPPALADMDSDGDLDFAICRDLTSGSGGDDDIFVIISDFIRGWTYWPGVGPDETDCQLYESEDLGEGESYISLRVIKPWPYLTMDANAIEVIVWRINTSGVLDAAPSHRQIFHHDNQDPLETFIWCDLFLNETAGHFEDFDGVYKLEMRAVKTQVVNGSDVIVQVYPTGFFFWTPRLVHHHDEEDAAVLPYNPVPGASAFPYPEPTPRFPRNILYSEHDLSGGQGPGTPPPPGGDGTGSGNGSSGGG